MNIIDLKLDDKETCKDYENATKTKKYVYKYTFNCLHFYLVFIPIYYNIPIYASL